MAKEKKEKEEKSNMLGAKEVADRLKIDPKYLRTILRSLPQFKNNDRQRYEWEPNDPFLKKLPGIVEAYREEHEREAKAKTEKKAKGGKKAVVSKKGKKANGKSKKEEEEGDEELEEIEAA